MQLSLRKKKKKLQKGQKTIIIVAANTRVLYYKSCDGLCELSSLDIFPSAAALKPHLCKNVLSLEASHHRQKTSLVCARHMTSHMYFYDAFIVGFFFFLSFPTWGSINNLPLSLDDKELLRRSACKTTQGQNFLFSRIIQVKHTFACWIIVSACWELCYTGRSGWCMCIVGLVTVRFALDSQFEAVKWSVCPAQTERLFDEFFHS